MYGGAMPEAGGLWDELMGLVDQPSSYEPSPEPTGIHVGNINDDGTYNQRSCEEVDNEIWLQKRQQVLGMAYEEFQAERRKAISHANLEAMGFKVIQDDGSKTLFEQLGGTIATGD